jgi:hypothetical protein
MDFIERVFHIAPDGGNGLTELTILLGFVCICALLVTRVLASRLNSIDNDGK